MCALALSVFCLVICCAPEPLNLGVLLVWSCRLVTAPLFKLCTEGPAALNRAYGSRHQHRCRQHADKARCIRSPQDALSANNVSSAVQQSAA